MCGRVFLVLYPPDTHTQALIAAQPIQGRAGVNHLATTTYTFTCCSACQVQCFPTGEATEAAFRARHRWAARRVAHLLKGLPDRPPLQAASEVIESASVNIGLVVEGQPFLGSSVDVLSASGGLEGNYL